MNVWRLITHWNKPEAVLDWSQKNGRIAIGWGRAGDLRGQNYTSARAIVAAVREEYPGLQNAPFSGVQLWNFCHTLAVDDLVILSTGKRRALVVQVQGDYNFVSSEEAPLGDDFQHQRKVRITQLDPDHLWHLAGSQPAVGQNIRWTLIKCLRPVDASQHKG